MPQIEFTQQELSAFREELFKGFTDSQFNLCIGECARRGLVPGNHVVFQLRNSKEWDATLGASVSTKKIVKITTLEAMRLIAQRSNEFEGQGKARWTYLDDDGNPTITSTIPLPTPGNRLVPREPWTCAVPVYRKGHRYETEVEARFDAYAVTTRRGNETVLTDMWSRRGPEMLAKASTVAALRAAYPEELGGLYLQEEFHREDAEKAAETPAAPVVVVPVPRVAVVPTVDHKPAQPTNAARPGHEVPDVTMIGTAVADTIIATDFGPTAIDAVSEEKPKKTRKVKAEAPEPEQSESHVIVGGNTNTTPIATDDDLPASMFEDEGVRKMDNPDEEMMHNELVDNRLPNKAEGTEIAVKVRSYYAHVANKDLQSYILKTAGKVYGSDITAPAQIPMRVWTEVFAKMDAELEKGGKAALVNLVTF